MRKTSGTTLVEILRKPAAHSAQEIWQSLAHVVLRPTKPDMRKRLPCLRHNVSRRLLVYFHHRRAAGVAFGRQLPPGDEHAGSGWQLAAPPYARPPAPHAIPTRRYVLAYPPTKDSVKFKSFYTGYRRLVDGIWSLSWPRAILCAWRARCGAIARKNNLVISMKPPCRPTSTTFDPVFVSVGLGVPKPLHCQANRL